MQFSFQAEQVGRRSLPLHGLRGIAALLVLFSHLGNVSMWLVPIPHDAVGKVGVWIFFSLSAFLLTRGLCSALARHGTFAQPLISYGIHRVMRIYPLLIVVLLLHWVLGELTVASVGRHLILQEGVAELWAISVEFKYYLVVPLVALAAQHLPLRWVSLGLLAGVLVSLGYGLANPHSVFSNELALLPKVSPFLLGSLLALHVDTLQVALDRLAEEGRFRWLRLLLSSYGQLLLWGGFLMSMVLFREMNKGNFSNEMSSLLGLMLACSAVGLILVSLYTTWTAALLSNRVLVFFGEISFSIYLLHMFVVHAMVRWGADLPNGLQAWLVVALCIPLAYFSWRFIECSGIQAGRQFGSWLQVLMRRRHTFS